MSKSYDLSTNSKWASLSYGNHTVKIKSVGDGFGDSSFSNSATVTKSIIERGTYKWIDSPTITVDNQTDFSFTSNGESYTMVRTHIGAEGNYISYTDASNAVIGYFSGHGWGTHSLNNGEWSSMEVKPAYQIITLEDDIEVPTDFYNWAITGGNLVKSEILEAGTYKWVDSPNLPSDMLEVKFAFSSGTESYYGVLVLDDVLSYFSGEGGVSPFPAYSLNAGGWTEESYKYITLSTTQTVSAEFYNWAITGGNLEKIEYTATVKVNGSCDAANCPIKLYDGSDANGTLLTTITKTHLLEKLELFQ